MSKLVKFPILISVIVLVIIISSFFLYSAAFYPSLHSDHALNILMAHKYSLPEAIYCWNQDRGGTFIPFISQLFIKGFGMSSIYAVSVSNYLILTLGFLGFARLFKHKELLIPFALIWFFPYQRFIDITSYPIGMSYSILGISLLFILNINFKKHLIKNIPNLIKIIFAGISWLCAVWVSDLMFISLLSIGLMGIVYILFNRKKIEFNYRLAILCYGIILAIIGFAIIQLKSLATGVSENFNSLNSLSEITAGFKIVWKSILKALFEEHLFTAIGAWIILAFVISALIYVILNFKSFLFFKDFWTSLFFIDFLATLSVIFTSKWVLLNDYGRWYFVAPYISCSIFIFLLIDKKSIFSLSYVKTSFILSILLFLIGVSTVEAIYKEEGKFKSEYATIQELNKLGEIGIIGDYWSSYKLSVVNPDKVKSTPHQHSGVRNVDLVFETLNQPKIYIVKDNWMDSFPDSLHQFGYLLLKKGNPFYLAKSNLCEYEISKETILTSEQLNYNDNAILNPDKTIQFSNKETINKHAIFGPNIPLIPGKYTAEFYIADIDINSLNDELIADVTTDYGNNVMVSKLLNTDCYNKEKGCFILKFDIKDIVKNNTEFRIYVAKPIDFTFQKIVVRRMD